MLLAGCYRRVEIAPAPIRDGSPDALPDAPPDAPIDVPLDAVPTMFVQQNTAGSQLGTSISVTLPMMPTTNHILLAIGGSQNGANAPTGAVASWQLVGRSLVSPTQYIYVGTPNGTGATVTLTTSNAGQIWLAVSEWNGISASNPTDASAGSGSVGVGSGAVDVKITTTSAPDLVVFAASSYGSVAAPPGTWAALSDAVAGSSVRQKTWYQLVWAPGMQRVQTTFVSDYDAVLAALRTIP